MLKNPKISIIIPVYNAENFIKKGIESILEQDYSNFEIILINDGSQDKSGEICKKYCDKDERIYYIEKENGGQSTARNMGIKKSKGKYIVFMDADDFWRTGHLKSMIDTIEKKNSDVLMFKAYSYYESQDILKPFSVDYDEKVFKKKGINVLKEILEKDYTFGWCPIWYIIKREIIVNNNLYFPEGYYCEDMEFVFRLWNCIKDISYYNEYVYVYRRENESSTTHIASLKFCRDLIYILKKNLKLLDEYRYDKELKNLIYLNSQTLVSVVLYWYGKYSKEERKQLKSDIEEIKIIYNIDKEYSYFMKKRERIIKIIIRTLGINNLGNLWGIRRWMQKKLA